MLAGLPVPGGFVASACAGEETIRAAYEEIKIREKTHFVAVRGATHSVPNVIGPDTLIHTVRRFWAESRHSPLLIQRTIHAMWCGKAHWHRKNLRIKANEGMLVLDPDTYLVKSETGKCIRHVIEPKQRKMIRHVDGSVKVVERDGGRNPMPAALLSKIAALAVTAGSDLAWAIDDLDQVWLISVYARTDTT